ncbi:hypothetical protein FRC11_008746 [Ceratobasidium sp. 423]|nr:hypothetical protein FRC11_008746 [Ceratobasidium sp. 423]
MQVGSELELNPLPTGVPLRQIYSDFLGYLLKHTRAYFEDRILDGRQIWECYSPTMEVVIAHPNGWGTREQAFLRSAAVSAGFSTTDQARRKIQFVSEAEASVHFCIHHTNLGNVFRTGDIFVDLEAEKFLRRTLTGAGLNMHDVEDYTKAGVKDFRDLAKRAFKDETTEHYIAVGNCHFNNPAIRARRGRLTLSGSTIKGFFDVCIKEIIGSIDQQLMSLSARHILLAGEFGDSPYLRQEFKKRYEPLGCQLSRTNDSTSKAVADGAVIWKVVHEFSNCPLQFSWGMETSVAFDQNDPDHQDRKDTLLASHWAVLPGRWNSFASKGFIPDVSATVRIPFSLDFSSPSPELGQFEFTVYKYSGDDEPVWMKDTQGELLPKFCKAATIQLNLDDLRGALKSRIALNNILKWQLDFNACMRFTEGGLEAYFEWEQEGIEQTRPTSIPLLDEV